jgi:hypothetical protein
LLDYVALFVIFFLMIAATSAILFFGSLPGMIARKRGHPWPDAIEAASWIGHIFPFFYPIAWIWAFLPFPDPGTGNTSDTHEAKDDDLARLRARLEKLDEAVARLQTQSESDTR